MDKIEYLIKKFQTGNKMSKPEKMAQSAEKFFDGARLLYLKLTDPKKYFEKITGGLYKPLIETTNTALEDFDVQKKLEESMNNIPSLQQIINAKSFSIMEEAIQQKYNKQNT